MGLYPFLISTFILIHDDGRYANSSLRNWFENLSSGIGRCCAESDGHPVEDGDWDIQGDHYRVRWWGKWMDVPDNAVVNTPNLAKQAWVWVWSDESRTERVHCFIPGPGA
jgi:hypothetical protein